MSVLCSICRRAFFYGVLVCHNSVWALPYLHVNLLPYQLGMFSVYSYVAGVLYEYDTHPNAYSGIKVDFEKMGVYYDPLCGQNWWEYYCEPISFGYISGEVKQFDISEYVNYAYFTERQLSRGQVFRLIQKYIKIRPAIQKKVDEFFQKNLQGNYVIAVHYRGTDKQMEAPRLAYEVVALAVEEYICKHSLPGYKIFVASDEQSFIDYMQAQFPEKVFNYPAARSGDDTALHVHAENPYLNGEDAIIDCLVLARGDVLIRTSSNLSLWSTYFNPHMPVIEVSKRY